MSEHDHDEQLTSPDEVKEPKLKFAIALTSVTLVGEIIGGWWTGSLALLIPAAMLVAPLLPREAVLHPGGMVISLPAVFLAAVFALAGAAMGGLELAQNNYLLEMAPPRKRSTYLGFLYTVGVPLAWAPFVASLLIGPGDRFMLGFGLSLLAALVCLHSILRLSEVREEEA